MLFWFTVWEGLKDKYALLGEKTEYLAEVQLAHWHNYFEKGDVIKSDPPEDLITVPTF